MASNQAIRSGNIWWSWNTDLGSSFIGAYSFYTLGSPFFWLSMLFPYSVFPYLSALLLILKYGCAGLFAYAYIGRHVRSESSALIGAFLYAFSGFQLGNMFYNHFLDVTALFPLLLLAFDELMEHDRKGFFALLVALSAMVNYYFFIGEVVFLIIYFVCRFLTGEYRLNVKKTVALVLEGLLGVGVSAVMLLPSLLFTLQIPRAVNKISGLSTLVYHPSVYLSLLKAILMPAEAVTHSIITATNWASTEAYLPVFSVVLVFAYVFAKRRDWLSVAMVVCMMFALIPLLNSLFYALNGQYYSRWFYMPVLLMALASAKVLDEKIPVKKGVVATLVLWLVFIVGLAVANKKQSVIIDKRLLLFMVVLLLLSAFFFILIYIVRNRRVYFVVTVLFLMTFSIISGVFNIWADQRTYPPTGEFSQIYYKEGGQLNLNDSSTYRVDTTNCYYNFSLLLNKPTINFFSSTVNGSVSDFYNLLGVTRVNNSDPDFSEYGLRALLSVKYVISLDKTGLPMVSRQDISLLPSLREAGHQGDYTIYYNEDFIPFGFTFDRCVSEQQLSQVSEKERHLALLKAIELTPRQISKYKALLPEITTEKLYDLTKKAYGEDVAARKAEASYAFERTRDGFSAGIRLEKDNLVFFSVPFDQGWSATVNGWPAQIEKVDAGFMAVKASAGDNTIRFVYRPQGFNVGLIITIVSIISLVAYLCLMPRLRQRKT